MKVLLAPLYFRKRMCKHCARAFYRANPGGWIGLHEFESLPPLGSFDPDRGFVPDFPALMMFDEYVLDGAAYELLANPGNRWWLGHWHELADALRAEGSLSIEDVEAAGKARSQERGAMLRRDVQRPDRWWQAMSYYNSLTSRAEQLLGARPSEARALAWNFDPERGLVVEGSDGRLHDLAAILADAGRSTSDAHRELLGVALAEVRDQLREVNACLVACDELAVAPVVWAPYRKYLEAKLADSSALTDQQAASDFFKVSFPAYAPTTVREFVEVRSHRGITALRSEIRRAAETGEALDPEYPQRVLTEILKIETKAARMRKILGRIATAVGVIPVPGLGLAASTAVEGASVLMDKKRRRPWRWFYVVSDGRGVT